MPSTRVFVHIGPLKTGTTFLQSVLVQNKQALAVNGVLFPRQTYALQIKSTLDLLHKRMHPESTGNPGQWDILAEEVRSWPGETVVISQEFLCAASPAQARRMVESLAPAEVHIVHTARDFTKVIPAMWQTHLRNKQPLSWDEYITSVRNPSAGGAPWGKRLWRQQDPAQVLPPFETVVPRERVHLVTVPPAASTALIALPEAPVTSKASLLLSSPWPSRRTPSLVRRMRPASFSASTVIGCLALSRPASTAA